MTTTAVPRVDGSVALGDGRRFAYSEWGTPDGTPVVLLHGTPGSRLFCPDKGATLAAGVRLITLDRPGYGGSDPLPGRTIPGFVDDFARLLDALEIESCPVIGWSGGGAYALVSGLRLPGRVARVGTIGSPGPRWEIPQAQADTPPDMEALFLRLRDGDDTAMDEVHQLLGYYVENPAVNLDRGLAMEDNPDRVFLAIPHVGDAFRVMWTEGARQGVEGFAADFRAAAMGWGFELSEVETEVWLWHGDADPIVPLYHAHYLADTLPSAHLVVLPGRGHGVAVPYWAEILDALI